MKKKISAEQIAELRAEWTKLCAENFAKYGDIGCCILGAGIKDGYNMVISVREVTPVQGNLVFETGVSELVRKSNAKYGTKLHYEYGNMD
jgi:hypothetical protein